MRDVLGKEGNQPTLSPRQTEIYRWWTKSDALAILISGGERSGKSLLTAVLLALHIKPGSSYQDNLYWIVGPDYRQARPEFTYLYQIFSNLDLVTDLSMPASESVPWSMKLKIGVTVQTRSSSDITKLASFSVSGAAMVEAAQQLYEVYYKLLGRLSETGGPLIVSGTIERGLPWFTDLYERWQGDNPLDARSWSLPTWSNIDIYPGGREDPRIKKLEAEFPEDLFMERFGGQPSPSTGLVLPEFSMQTHVKKLQYSENGSPVRLCIDPGTNCYAVLLVQHIGMITNVLDRVYMRGTIVQEVIPKVMGSRYWKYVELGDAGTIDQAGAQHPGSYSQVELWRQLSGAELQYRYIYEDDTIRTLRWRLGTNNPLHKPLIYFDSSMTNSRSPSGEALDVLAEPALWRWPERGFRKNEPRRPVDRNNHAMKALGYELVHWFGVSLESQRSRRSVRRKYYGIREWPHSQKSIF